MATNDNRLEKIEITGIVQGVGFRPFIYNLAASYNLSGYVMNNPYGVVINAEGKPDNIDAFVTEIQTSAPPLSKIKGIKRQILSGHPHQTTYHGFEIRLSASEGKPVTLISPDVCVCEDCLRELFDPKDRRFLYPFINCTNCGPRFTIIQQLPYDRPFTTMKSFQLCPDCKAEYESPVNRRFHAQPNACPVCGPQLQLTDSNGKTIDGDPLQRTINLLKEGRILAIKGLGGFHLAVDATSKSAVNRLRERKHREEKSLALMVGNPETAEQLMHLTPAEKELLLSRERPILLANRRHDSELANTIAASVAPHNPYLGLMLPYTPLHYLLFYHPGEGGDYIRNNPIFTALVMTSGNISEEPICKDNDEAFERLRGIADAFLIHNRDIHIRCDDSIAYIINDNVSISRRSRGFAPEPIFLPDTMPTILAFGAELKNSLCLTDNKRAFISQYIGDLENVPTLGFFKEAVEHFTKILDIQPKTFAYDLHPEYLSTKYCHALLNEFPKIYNAVGVQHHHAHIASVLAEHGHDRPVIGFPMDGTGYGLDGNIWGGEVLISNAESFVRYAHLDYMPLPGGSAAIRQPWRMAFAFLRKTFENDWASLNLNCLRQMPLSELEILNQACRAGINCPLTSSLGRLFDAVASLLDIKHVSTYEGQPAMMLEMYADREKTSKTFPYHLHSTPPETFGNYPVVHNLDTTTETTQNIKTDETVILDFIPTIRALVEEIKKGKPSPELSSAFHNTLLDAFLNIARRTREATGISEVVLSGGCWQNRLLNGTFQNMLTRDGFKVLTNQQVPVNDGGISLGQVYIAGKILQKIGRK